MTSRPPSQPVTSGPDSTPRGKHRPLKPSSAVASLPVEDDSTPARIQRVEVRRSVARRYLREFASQPFRRIVLSAAPPPAEVTNARPVPRDSSRKKKKKSRKQAATRPDHAGSAPVPVLPAVPSAPAPAEVAPAPVENVAVVEAAAKETPPADAAVPPEARRDVHGAPASFDSHVQVMGPVAVPAEFRASSAPPDPHGAPASFEPHVQVAGPVAVPAEFQPPDPPPVLARQSAPPLPSTLRPVPKVAPSRRKWAGAALLMGVASVALGISVWRQRPAPVVVPPPPPVLPQPVYARLDAPLRLPPSEKTFEFLPPRPQQVVIRSGSPLKVALTFDACSTPGFVGWDPRVADILERYEVPATFFLGGRFIAQRPDIVRLLAENPRFDLQGHTYLHPHLPEVSARRVVQELLRTDQALFDVTGRRATMFRPPFGEYSPEVVKAATRAGYLPIQFDVASGDPDPGFHATRLLESVLTQVQGGSIVVLHANGHGFHTPDALALIIDALRERGFELTTVGDVLADGEWVVDDGRKGPRRKLPPPPVRPAPPPPPGETTTVSAAAKPGVP